MKSGWSNKMSIFAMMNVLKEGNEHQNRFLTLQAWFWYPLILNWYCQFGKNEVQKSTVLWSGWVSIFNCWIVSGLPSVVILLSFKVNWSGNDAHCTIFSVNVSYTKITREIAKTLKNVNFSSTTVGIWNSKMSLESPQNSLSGSPWSICPFF